MATTAANDQPPTPPWAPSLPNLVGENVRLRCLLASLVAHATGVVEVWQEVDDDLGDLDDAIGCLSDILAAASDELLAPALCARTA